MKQIVTMGIIAGLAAVVAVHASAASYTIKYYGAVDSGTDETGVFGSANTSLVGAAFKAQFNLNYPTPGALSSAAANRDGVYGGSYFGAIPSPVSGSYTINGHTVAIAGDFIGRVVQWHNAISSNNNVYDQIAHFAYDKIEIGDYSYKALVSLSAYNLGHMVDSTNFTDPLNYTAPTNDCINDCAGGNFFIYERTFNGSYNVYSQNASGTVLINRITIGPAGSVPEPAAWAMLILGFGMVGVVQRKSQQRRQTVAS
jgi:hypothetical protein